MNATPSRNPMSAAQPGFTDEPGSPLADDPLLDDPDAEPPLAEGEPSFAAAAEAGRPLAVAVGDEQLQAWIDAIVDRDERALSALYDATVTRLYGFVRCIVRNAALAEEVVEDTYFQVWRQAVRFDPARGRALTWLLGMARSRAIDALRREARFQCESLDADTAPDRADPSPASDDLLEVARNHAELHRALMQLQAQPRQLVALAFFRGLSHEEIASQTALPLGTVKSQIRRALITLRQVLGEGASPLFAL